MSLPRSSVTWRTGSLKGTVRHGRWKRPLFPWRQEGTCPLMKLDSFGRGQILVNLTHPPQTPVSVSWATYGSWWHSVEVVQGSGAWRPCAKLWDTRPRLLTENYETEWHNRIKTNKFICVYINSIYIYNITAVRALKFKKTKQNKYKQTTTFLRIREKPAKMAPSTREADNDQGSLMWHLCTVEGRLWGYVSVHHLTWGYIHTYSRTDFYTSHSLAAQWLYTACCFCFCQWLSGATIHYAAQITK